MAIIIIYNITDNDYRKRRNAYLKVQMSNGLGIYVRAVRSNTLTGTNVSHAVPVQICRGKYQTINAAKRSVERADLYGIATARFDLRRFS